MDDIIKTMPSNYFYSVKNSTNHIFLNIDNNKSNVGASAWIWKEISAKMENNTILGITYEGIDPSKELTIYWSATNGGNNVVPGGANTATYNNSTVLYTTIKPYCSKQFLYLTSGTNNLGPKDDSVEQQIIGDETSEVQGFMLIQD